jgi:hypothetical protein
MFGVYTQSNKLHRRVIMSFVSVVATGKLLSVMSDGRMTGENNKVLREGVKKFYKVGDRKFVAFSGSADQSREIADQIKNKLEIGIDFSVINALLSDLFNSNDFKKIGCKVFLYYGGINPQGDIEVFESVSTANGSTSQKYLPTGNKPIVRFSIGHIVDPEFNIKGKCLELFNSDMTVDDSFHKQEALNSYVAQFDDCVNTNVYHMVIEK